MNPVVAHTLTAVLLLLLLLASLISYSVHGFSRGRLGSLCEERGCNDVFLDILRHWRHALLVADVVTLLVLLGLIAVAVPTWRLLTPLPETGQAAFIVEAVFRWIGFAAVAGLCGTLLPNVLARVTGERYLLTVWPLLQTLVLVMRPITGLSAWLDTILHRLYELEEPDHSDPETLAEEIRTVVDAGELLGAIQPHAGSMIDQVMDLKDADVASIMTPRTEVDSIQINMSLEQAREVMLEAGHTRMPVIGESTDDIVGILYAKDLLRFFGGPRESMPQLREICRDAFYVPETTSVDKLLETMNRKRVHMAIVLDEYGGVAGLVTMEDILEEIVGEIVDEYDDEEEDPIREISQNIVEVDARVHIDDLVEDYGFDDLPEERDYDTIGGFVFSHLGRIPQPDESFEFGRVRVRVLDANERRVLKVRLELDESLNPVGHDDE
ncbi:CBS domain-containing protein [bacterium]|nr:CBS domain-containing protein [bacterium]